MTNGVSLDGSGGRFIVVVLMHQGRETAVHVPVPESWQQALAEQTSSLDWCRFAWQLMCVVASQAWPALASAELSFVLAHSDKAQGVRVMRCAEDLLGLAHQGSWRWVLHVDVRDRPRKRDRASLDEDLTQQQLLMLDQSDRDEQQSLLYDVLLDLPRDMRAKRRRLAARAPHRDDDVNCEAGLSLPLFSRSQDSSEHASQACQCLHDALCDLCLCTLSPLVLPATRKRSRARSDSPASRDAATSQSKRRMTSEAAPSAP